MSLIEDGTAGRLVHTAALHAHQTVLHHIVQTDAIAAADLIQLGNEDGGLHLFAVQAHRHALFKCQLHELGLVRCGLGADTQLQKARLIVLRLVARVLKVKALMAQVPQVLILGVVGLAVDLQRDVMCLGIVDLFVTALDVPLTPRSDDLQVRCKVHDGQFKAHLIVALAGAAVAHGICTLGAGDLHHTLCQNGSCKAGAQQIALVIGPGLHGGDDVILHKFIGQIFYVQLGSTACLGALFQTFQLALLAHIAAHCNDLAVVVMLFQPWDDNGSIQTAGIGQHDLFDLRHKNRLRSNHFILLNSLLQFLIAVLLY